MVTTIVLASTAPGHDGRSYTTDELLAVAAYLNLWGKGTYNNAPSPLPQFDGYPYCLRAWVSIPTPGGPSTLCVSGSLTCDFARAVRDANVAGQVALARMLVPGGGDDE